MALEGRAKSPIYDCYDFFICESFGLLYIFRRLLHATLQHVYNKLVITKVLLTSHLYTYSVSQLKLGQNSNLLKHNDTQHKTHVVLATLTAIYFT